MGGSCLGRGIFCRDRGIIHIAFINADLFNELPQEVYDAYNKVKAPKGAAVVVGVTNMTIEFKSDLELKNAYDVINRLAEDEKTIILNTISSSLETTGNEPTQGISAELTLYSIFPLDTEKLKNEPETIEEAVEAARKAATEAPVAAE